jgi:ketosteroid isomerase-like protein
MGLTKSARMMIAFIVICVAAAGTAHSSDGMDSEGRAAELRATETAFAKTMADRDHEAFVSFLADEAVFFGGRGEIRGKMAVAKAWQPYFDGPEAPFAWKPETATVLDSGALGLTSGPVLGPDGSRIGTFNSVWRRQPGGGWKIVFDKGCPDCECPPKEG